VSGELRGVYGLTQQGTGPIPPQVVKTIEDALAHYQTLKGQLAAIGR
jgi:hypothetical protein